jgi:nitroreductase
MAPSDPLAGLGSNERALLERVPTLPLRRLAAHIVRTKERLQFTGWLQYVIPLIPASGITLLAAFIWLLGFPRAAAGVGVAPAFIACVAVFDVVTSKLKIRPRERRPATLESLDVFDLMLARRSCRSYQARPLDDADRDAVLASVRRYIAEETFSRSPVRLEYVKAPLTIWPVVNAGEFLVAIVPKPYDRHSVIDVGRTLQKVVIDATRLGLGTCWIGPGADHESLRAHLGEKFNDETEQLICVCAIGYPSRFSPLFVRVFTRMMRRRRPTEDLFFIDDALETPADLDSAPLSRWSRHFEACRWGPSSYNGQTTRAVLRTDNDGELVGVDFCAITASRFYAPVALGIWCTNWELGAEATGASGRFIAMRTDEDVVVPRQDVSWKPDGA